MQGDAGHDSSRSQLVMYRLGSGLRALLAMTIAWWAGRRTADTSIAWEDGETG